MKYLASEREIWLRFLYQLKEFQTPDVRPHDAVFNSDLRDLTIRAVRGSLNWASLNPLPTRRYVLHMRQKSYTSNPQRNSDAFRGFWSDSHLIAGGKYLVFIQEGELVCWDVISDKCIWTRHREDSDWNARDLAVKYMNEESGGGSILIANIFSDAVVSSKLFVAPISLKTTSDNLKAYFRFANFICQACDATPWAR